MKLLFIVQGEGRGHMTQAVAFYQLVQNSPHSVVGVLVGSATQRPLPAFFLKPFTDVPLYTFQSPCLEYAEKKGKLSISKTIYKHILKTNKYVESLRYIHQTVQELKPDLIVNFYELLAGLYKGLFRPSIPMIAVAHQYLLEHPEFVFPRHNRLDRWLVHCNSHITAWGAERKMGLAFRPMSQLKVGRLMVAPPLLRREVTLLQPEDTDYLLVYLTHHSLRSAIVEWHQQYPEVALHCFGHFPDSPEEESISPTLCFHQLNASKFLDFMRRCRALVTTAGFESVCEAMYLGKPVLMVPVPGHFEQACNALDGMISGAGVASGTFDLSVLDTYIPYYQSPRKEFVHWLNQAQRCFLNEMAEVVATAPISSAQPAAPSPIPA